MSTLALSCLLVGLAALGLPTADAQAENGHCMYRQFSPKLRLWYRACEMPATPERCKELVSDYRQQLEYGDGACITKGAHGVCLVDNNQIVFYQGDSETLAKGCEMLHGQWRPDLLPKS